MTQNLDYYLKEGWVMLDAKCNHCHYAWAALVEPQTDATKLECPKCHAADSSFLIIHGIMDTPES